MNGSPTTTLDERQDGKTTAAMVHPIVIRHRPEVAISKQDLVGDRLIVAAQYQVEFPRSKRRRIRRKWQKQWWRFRPTPYGGAVRRDGVIVLHPAWVQAAEDNIKRQIEREIFYG